jgi:putative DNA primase/helicase
MTEGTELQGMPSIEIDKAFKKDVLGATLPTPSTPPTRRQVLMKILDMVGPVNFRELARVTEDINIHRGHQKVVAVRELLKLAEAIGFGMCRRHDVAYVFNTAYWVSVEAYEMRGFLGAAAEKMGVPEVVAHDVDFRKQLYEQFLSAAHMEVTESGPKAILINLENGTFEFSPEGCKLRAHQPEDFITYLLPFSHDPDAKAPIFKAYLDKVLPDPERQRVLGEFCGYIFTREIKLDKALLLLGSGANGKSVFFNILKAVLGSDNCSSFSLSKLTSTQAIGDYTRAKIDNKLVNYAPEITGISDIGLFKQLVSIEPIDGRNPYGSMFQLTDYAKLIVNCNELPRAFESTDAYLRRFAILPFDVTIPERERDIHLADKIIATELPGVFNWILEGLSRIVQQCRLSDCQASNDALHEYATESDSVALFMVETGYRQSADNAISLDVLYKEYQQYCSMDGYHSVSKKNFSKRLRHQKYYIDRRNYGNVVFAAKVSTPPDTPEVESGGTSIV